MIFNRVQKLSLENTLCGDKGCRLLSEALLYNNSLIMLNLSKCNLSDILASSIADFIESNFSISILILHWNQITGDGCSLIASKLEDNRHMQIFDASYNSFGICSENKAAKALRQLFLRNKLLLHVDLSGNKFHSADISLISSCMNRGRIGQKS